MDNAQVIGTEELVLRWIGDGVPQPPIDMNGIIFEHQDNEIYTHSAVCIELELDACGNSVKEARDELIKVIEMYLSDLKRASENDGDFVTHLIETIFSESPQKNELFELYRKAKQKYLITKAKENIVPYPRELKYALALSSSLNEDKMLLSAVR